MLKVFEENQEMFKPFDIVTVINPKSSYLMMQGCVLSSSTAIDTLWYEVSTHCPVSGKPKTAYFREGELELANT